MNQGRSTYNNSLTWYYHPIGRRWVVVRTESLYKRRPPQRLHFPEPQPKLLQAVPPTTRTGPRATAPVPRITLSLAVPTATSPSTRQLTPRPPTPDRLALVHGCPRISPRHAIQADVHGCPPSELWSTRLALCTGSSTTVPFHFGHHRPHHQELRCVCSPAVGCPVSHPLRRRSYTARPKLVDCFAAAVAAHYYGGQVGRTDEQWTNSSPS